MASARNTTVASDDGHKQGSVRKDFPVVWIPRKPDEAPRHSFLLALKNTTIKELNVLGDCRITSQLALDTTTWSLETYDIIGNAKTVGGDEFYISYRDLDSPDNIAAVAKTIDHRNGTYSLDFTVSPWFANDLSLLPQKGMLVIWLEYSCGVGAMERPLRNGWSCNGATLTNWNVTDVPLPPVRKFRKPIVPIDLGQYRSVISVGDTAMMNFVGRQRSNGYFFYKNLAFGKYRREPLLERSVSHWLDVTMNRLSVFFRVHNQTALIIGSAALELQSPYGIDADQQKKQQQKQEGDDDVAIADESLIASHLRAVQYVLTEIRKSYPTLTILWKSAQAIHLHEVVARTEEKADWWCHVDRLIYMSQSRTFRLYQLQKDLMEKMNIPVLDLYEATYLMADRHKSPGDAVHYDTDTNAKLIEWFYPLGGVNETIYGTEEKEKEDTMDPKQKTENPTDTLEKVESNASTHDSVVWIPSKPDDAPRQSFLIALENTTLRESDVLRGCPITAQLSLDTSTWTLQTHDINRQPKTVGGDEFYISYRDPANLANITAASVTTDHGNGTYSLHFTTSPWLDDNKDPSSLRAKGVLVIWLEYSCGVGAMERPLRDEWTCNGASLINWNATGIPRPPMRVFQRPPTSIVVDLGQYRSVLGVGDSIMQQFVSSTFNRYHYKNLAFGKNPRDPLLMRTIDQYRKPATTRLNAFSQIHNRSVLIMGTAAWELQSPYGKDGIRQQDDNLVTDQELFESHLNALRQLLTEIREKFPSLPIFWKLGQAFHLHEVARVHGDEWRQITRLDYMSQSRTYKLYRLQKDLMNELNIPVLDLFETTYLMADRHRIPGDAIHYDIETNARMISWFYPQGGVNESIYPTDNK